jgi:hypothetical protein
VGVPVLAGMLAAALLGIFFVPALYVVFQRLRELPQSRRRAAEAKAGAGETAPVGAGGEPGAGAEGARN